MDFFTNTKQVKCLASEVLIQFMTHVALEIRIVLYRIENNYFTPVPTSPQWVDC